MTKRLKIVTVSLASIAFIVFIGINLALMKNEAYRYQAVSGLGISVTIHFLIISFLTFYNFIRKDRYLGYSYLICVGIDISGFTTAFVWAINSILNGITFRG